MSLELQPNNLAATGGDEAAPLPCLRALQGQDIPSGGMEGDGKAQKVVPFLLQNSCDPLIWPQLPVVLDVSTSAAKRQSCSPIPKLQLQVINSIPCTAADLLNDTSRFASFERNTLI